VPIVCPLTFGEKLRKKTKQKNHVEEKNSGYVQTGRIKKGVPCLFINTDILKARSCKRKNPKRREWARKGGGNWQGSCFFVSFAKQAELGRSGDQERIRNVSGIKVAICSRLGRQAGGEAAGGRLECPEGVTVFLPIHHPLGGEDGQGTPATRTLAPSHKPKVGNSALEASSS